MLCTASFTRSFAFLPASQSETTTNSLVNTNMFRLQQSSEGVSIVHILHIKNDIVEFCFIGIFQV